MGNIIFDIKGTDEVDVNEKCPRCLTALSEHTIPELLRCYAFSDHGTSNQGTITK